MDNDTPVNDNTDPRGEETDAETVLANYALALQQEYETKVEETPDNVQEHTKDFFKAKVHTAAAQIVFLADHAESETVKLNANKFILTQAFADEDKEQNPLAELLKGLKKNGVPSTLPAPHES